MEISSDPYEQKLYHMFKSHDHDSIGTLDETALIKLCNSLELNDGGSILIKSMLENRNGRVSFKDFKDALLKFLGTEMDNVERDTNLIISQNNENRNHTVPDSPGREVSPKLIVGTKKYGRRSRPQSLVIDSSGSDTDNENELCAVVPNLNNKAAYKVQRSSSQSDMQATRKRRPGSGGTKLKRCASLPAQQRSQRTRDQQSLKQHQQQKQEPSSLVPDEQQQELASSVESLGNLDFENFSHKIYEIWRNYGNELGTYLLNRVQLQFVCERIGLLNKIAIKVAEEVFEKLNLNDTDTISYKDFIDLIQSDSTSTTTTTTTTINQKTTININSNCNDIEDDNDDVNRSSNCKNSLEIDNLKSLDTNNRDHMMMMTTASATTTIRTSSIDDLRSTIENNFINHNLKETSIDDLHAKDYSSYLETLPASNIIEMWKSVGVNEPRILLSNLGFDDDDENISVSHLLSTLEEEVRGLSGDSQVSVFKATLILRKVEITSLQQIFRQVVEENRKLRADNKDANRRAAMLAQEIDERHANLEDTTKSEIRLLEQRHAEVVRELTSQLASDREHWSQLNSRLEARIKHLEQEDNRLKCELQKTLDENSALENEQTSLQKQITDLLETNIKLNNEIVELEDKQRNDDGNVGDKDTEEMLELIDKITSLQVENANLRDKNDELVAEVESLNMQLTRYKSKKSSRNSELNGVAAAAGIDGVDIEAEQSNLGGVKRRGDSPSKTRIAEESPRLGKLRRCSNDGNNSESDTSSGDWVALNSEMNSTMVNNQQQHQQQQAMATTPTTIATSSGFSQDFSSISIENRDEEIGVLKEKISQLENELAELRNLSKNKNTLTDKEEETENKDNVKKTEETKDEKTNAVNDDTVDYEIRCQELENSLEQMRKAYEDCEDYWQAKLNEERQLFEKERQIYEEEQQENDKKFTELMEKVREYEEQFDKEGRLSPIEEKDNLEQQYADLEAEIEEIRKNSQKIYEEKAKEINNLQEQIKELRNKLGENADVMNLQNLNVNQVTTADGIDVESPVSSPISYLWNQSTIQMPARDYQNPNWNSKPKMNTSASSDTIKSDSITQDLNLASPPSTATTMTAPTCISPIQKPKSQNINNTNLNTKTLESSTTTNEQDVDNVSVKSYETHSIASTHSIHHKSSVPSSDDELQLLTPDQMKDELKKLKYVEVQLKEQIKDLAYKRDSLIMELQQLHEAKPVLEKAYARAAHPTLMQRVNQLEQKNRHLQNVIRQQQQYTESLMHQNWQQQRQEIIELRNRLEQQAILLAQQAQRLANADLLVKDLYVENSHLTATVQRLEQQRNRSALMHQHQGLTN